MEGCGLGMLWVGVQIAFRGDVWREGCHGSVSIVGHERCPCEGWQFRSTLCAHLMGSTDTTVCAPARLSGIRKKWRLNSEFTFFKFTIGRFSYIEFNSDFKILQ